MITAFLILTATLSLFARGPMSSFPQETVERLKKIYSDQSEEYLRERIKNAPNAFQKWRSFPPYYYDLLKRTEVDLKAREGLCAGDPHFENFGFINNGKPYFSLNDYDDVATCPLDADAMRLFISHRLLFNFKTEEWLDEYRAGLAGSKRSLPEALKELEKISKKFKTDLPKKLKDILKSGKCPDDNSSLLNDEQKSLSDYLVSEQKKLVLVCARVKHFGGSAGMKRYTLFYKGENETEAIELKPLAAPAPLYDKNLGNDERQKFYKEGVKTFLGSSFQDQYFPVLIEGKLFQRRPIFAGNVDVSESGLSAGDMREVGLYEARTLGLLHGLTNKDGFKHNKESWEKAADQIEKKWKTEFAE